MELTGQKGDALRSQPSFRDDLIEYAAEVGLGPGEFRPLAAAEADEVATVVGRTFGDAVRFLWWQYEGECALPSAANHFRNGDGSEHLARIAPQPDAPAWLIAKNEYRIVYYGESSETTYFVFEATLANIERVLINAHSFEYLVVSKSLDWLIAEDHHDIVIVVGAPVVERLQRIVSSANTPSD